MRFLGAGEIARMDVQRRDDILSLISAGREIETAALLQPRIVMSSPEVPVDHRVAALAASTKIFDAHDLVVRSIETRLKASHGPLWRDLSRQESEALAGWTKAADEMGQAVQQNVAESSGTTGVIFLIVLAAGAILAPLLFGTGDTKADAGLPSYTRDPGAAASLFARGGPSSFGGSLRRRSEIVSSREEE